MTVFSTNQFAGGMNDWIDPVLLESNMSPRLVNADVSSGKIVPVLARALQSNGDPTHYGHYGTRNRSLVKWYERTYWSNNAATTPPYYGGHEEDFLGIPYPAYVVGGTVDLSGGTVGITGGTVDFSGETVNVSGGTVTITGGTLSENVGGVAAIIEDNPASGETGISGTFKYCVTFVSANGWEGAPGSPESYEVSLTLSSKVGVVAVVATNPNVVSAHIYRTIDNGAEFYQVGSVVLSGGTASKEGIFRDTVTDEDAQMMNPLVTQNNYPPPAKGKFLCEFGGTFFIAVGDLLYFSANGNPHAWPMTQFISMGDPITGIVPEFQGVLVFTHGNVYRVTGAENPETVSKTYIPGNNGCKDWRSIGVLNNAPIWLSNDGICMWDGGSITIPSYRVMRTKFLTVKWASVVKDCYYLFLEKDAIVYDLRNGGIFYMLNFTCDYAWYDDVSDFFYMQEINGGNSSVYLYRYFGDDAPNTTFTYQTPDIGGGEAGCKIYREMATVCDGPCEVVFTVDGDYKGKVALPAGRQRVKFPFSAVGRKLSLTISASDTFRELAVIYD